MSGDGLGSGSKGGGSKGKKSDGDFWGSLRSLGSGLLEGFVGEARPTPRRDPVAERERPAAARQIHRSMKAWRDRESDEGAPGSDNEEQRAAENQGAAPEIDSSDATSAQTDSTEGREPEHQSEADPHGTPPQSEEASGEGEEKNAPPSLSVAAKLKGIHRKVFLASKSDDTIFRAAKEKKGTKEESPKPVLYEYLQRCGCDRPDVGVERITALCPEVEGLLLGSPFTEANNKGWNELVKQTQNPSQLRSLPPTIQKGKELQAAGFKVVFEQKDPTDSTVDVDVASVKPDGSLIEAYAVKRCVLGKAARRLTEAVGQLANAKAEKKHALIVIEGATLEQVKAGNYDKGLKINKGAAGDVEVTVRCEGDGKVVPL